MPEHCGTNDPFAGGVQVEEKSPVDILMDRLFACSDQTEYAVAELLIQGSHISGRINALDRSGANMISIGFIASRGVSVEWRGRKHQSKVTHVRANVFRLCDDGGRPLEITFRSEGRSPADSITI